MNNKSIIGIAVIVVIIVAAVGIYVAFSDDGYKAPANVNHNLDTVTNETITWSYLTGWEDEIIFVETDEHYESNLDTDDNQGFIFHYHDVEFAPGSTLPEGVTITVAHDGMTYWGYAWEIEGGTNTQGTWSGTVTYTVQDSSEYNGTVHTLHYTFSNYR